LVDNHRFEPTPPLATPLGVIWLKFRRDFWHQKTRVTGLSYGVIMWSYRSSHLCTTPTCDGRTDGQRDRHTMTAVLA